MSQDTPSARPLRRATKAVLAALALPAVLTLAACDGTNVAAPAMAVAQAADTASVHEAVCTKVETAWARYVPKAYTASAKPGVKKIDFAAYNTLSTGLYASLTGNREFKLAYDIDSLATDAGSVYSDHGQHLSPNKALSALKKGAAVVAEDCGTKLAVPAA